MTRLSLHACKQIPKPSDCRYQKYKSLSRNTFVIHYAATHHLFHSKECISVNFMYAAIKIRDRMVWNHSQGTPERRQQAVR